jgi:excisionase family DNA binding protein
MASQPAEQRWTYTPDEVASRLGVSAQLVREQCRDGHIRTIKMGRLYLVPRAEVARLTGEDPAPHENDSGHAERLENARLKGELRRLRDQLDRLIDDESA